MNLGSSASRARCALVWALATALGAALTAGLAPVLAEAAAVTRTGGLAAARFDDVLVWVSAAVAAAVTAWLWLVTTVVAADAARGHRGRRQGVPDGLRRGLLVLCGTALTAGLATPALAAGGTAFDPEVLVGLRLPERVGVRPPAAPAARSAPQHTSDRVVVVEPGDTLWSLAADLLGTHPTTAAVAAAWPDLYAANRDVVGPDPSHIVPGQRLVLPSEGDEHDAH